MLGAAIIKDIQLLLRDRGALASLFVLPVVFMAVFGAMFAGGDKDDKARPIAVYHEPGDTRAAGLMTAVAMSGVFAPRMQTSAEAVRQLVADEEFVAGLIIGVDFDPRAGRPAELVIDPASSPQVRGPVQGALTSILTVAYFSDPASGPVQVVRAVAPPGLDRADEGPDGFQVSVPGNSVLFGFFLALTVALSFVEERKSGTWLRLLAAPISRPLVLMAKLVPFVIIGLIQFGFLFGIGAAVFGMKVSGSVLALCLLTVVVVCCATALGLFIASFGGSEKQVGGIGSIVILVMGLLGGAMVPRPIMPETMQQIGLLVPHAWALDGYYAVLIRSGVGLADIWREIAAVAGFAVLFTGIGALRFRFER